MRENEAYMTTATSGFEFDPHVNGAHRKISPMFEAFYYRALGN